MSGEFDLIRRIRRETRTCPRVRLGPGDDCALLLPSRSATLITTDMLMEGVDFHLTEAGPRAVGRKAMAVNLSDIAAMAGIPTAAVISVALPQGNATRELADELMAGLHEVADEFGVPIVGGDTNSWTGGLVINVTVLGEPNPYSGPVLRSGAKVGDRIFVTGPCGGSILGRHLNPQPRIREAVELARRFRLHSMIDVSDGLSADLGHILEESGVGAVLNAEAIPIHPDAVRLSNRTRTPPLEHALGDGEDFELVFTVPQAEADGVARSGLAVEIGDVIANGYFLARNGRREMLVPTGWSHPFSISGSGDTAKHPLFVPSELTDEDARKIDDETYDRVLKRPDEFAERYLRESGNTNRDENGNLKSVTLNTDDFRPLFPEYRGSNSLAVHRAALAANAFLAQKLLVELRGKGNGRVLFLGGGSGSGKGTTAGRYYAAGQYPLTIDQTGTNYDNLVSAFDQAQKLGYGVDYSFVDRSPDFAWYGIVNRSIEQYQRGELPRTVNVRYAVESNLKARDATIQLLKCRLDLAVTVFVNSDDGMGRAIRNREDAIRHLESRVYNFDELVRRLTDDTRRLYERGEIPPHIAKGLIG